MAMTEMVISKKEFDEINAMLENAVDEDEYDEDEYDEDEYDEDEYDEDECDDEDGYEVVLREEVEFEDGCFADLEVIKTGEGAFVQMTWYNEDGEEICSSDSYDEIDGEWECAFDKKYNVNVVVE